MKNFQHSSKKCGRNFPVHCVMVAFGLLLSFSSGAVDLLVYTTENAGAGSLRQAIQDNYALGGGNNIVFLNTLTGTITLTSELVISTNVTILGPGRDVLTVKAISVRVFNIPSGTVVISGLTITRGQGLDGGGGGFYNAGTLHLAKCLIATNTGTIGGGVYNQGTLELTDCLFSANGAYDGGAVYSLGNLTVDRCAFVNNGASHFGGALMLTNGTASINNSTIVSNTASQGGALFNDPTNHALLTLTACTMVTNDASFAGGLYGPARVRNTIIAGNGWGNGPDGYDDVYGACNSEGFNIIGNTNASTGWGAVGDVGGTTGSAFDSDLLPLGLYGGSTPTMPPRPTSLAIDRGKSFGLTTDQRGRPRPFDNSAYTNANLGDGSDIGAVELSSLPLPVTTTNDAGPGSLRQAILNASPVDTEIVTFAPNVTNTIRLTTGELVVNKPLVIDGPGARMLRISGNGSNRVFHLTGGSVLLSGLTIANGWASDYGGGILVDAGSHTISQCHIVSNTAGLGGGGILAQSNSSLTVNSSSITHNQAAFAGGGIDQAGDFCPSS